LVAPDGLSDGQSEAELMRQVAAGEIGGLETLYDRYHSMAYALALRITTETGLAEDVVQDSFLGVWRNAARYAEAKGSVRGWLLAIVRHRAIDAMRRQRASVAIGEEADEAVPAALTLPDIWPEVAGRLDAEQIRLAMTALPPAQRDVIELAYFDGLTQREIAERTHAPLGTVKSRIRLGLASLRDQLVGPDEVTLSGSASISKKGMA
ncbi:MAG TPA: sigma-70 family RNA polymerase sigma factor, partial [Candidatus Limnocylindrales bacterium]